MNKTERHKFRVWDVYKNKDGKYIMIASIEGAPSGFVEVVDNNSYYLETKRAVGKMQFVGNVASDDEVVYSLEDFKEARRNTDRRLAILQKALAYAVRELEESLEVAVACRQNK